MTLPTPESLATTPIPILKKKKPKKSSYRAFLKSARTSNRAPVPFTLPEAIVFAKLDPL